MTPCTRLRNSEAIERKYYGSSVDLETMWSNWKLEKQILELKVRSLENIIIIMGIGEQYPEKRERRKSGKNNTKRF